MTMFLRLAENPNTPPRFQHGRNFQIHRAKYYYEIEKLSAFEFDELDLLLDTLDGPIVEAKYWTKNRILDDLLDPEASTLLDQLERHVRTGRPVIVEFGETLTPNSGVDADTLVYLRELLGDRVGAELINNVEILIVDSHLFKFP
jgi:hypothetical protein